MRGISLNSDQISFQNLANAPLAYTATYSKRYKIDQILIHFTAPVSETVTITYISENGNNYNTVLQEIVLVNETDFVWRPQGECNFQSEDQIHVQCTNAAQIGFVYLTIKSSQLGSGG